IQVPNSHRQPDRARILRVWLDWCSRDSFCFEQFERGWRAGKLSDADADLFRLEAEHGGLIAAEGAWLRRNPEGVPIETNRPIGVSNRQSHSSTDDVAFG